MNTLTLSIPYPTLEQLINFAGMYSMFVIFGLILLVLFALVFGIDDTVYGLGDFLLWVFGLAGFVALIPISMLPVMKDFDWSRRIVYSITTSSTFVVFYISALCGII